MNTDFLPLNYKVDGLTISVVDPVTMKNKIVATFLDEFFMAEILNPAQVIKDISDLEEKVEDLESDLYDSETENEKLKDLIKVPSSE